MPEKIQFKEESYAIQGAVFEVYRELGCGFLEAVYQECQERELRTRHIPFESQPQLQLVYKGQPLKQKYQPDFVCHNNIILELKTAKEIAPEHQAQILNYLKATGLKLGMLINFCSHPKATVQRFVK
jgi:GxxExxY protein